MNIVRITTMKKPPQNRMYGGIDASLREEERRKKLLEAGLEAFGTTGYAKTNIKQLCQLAGLTERYFYESFQNKEDLLSSVYRELINEQEHDAMEIFQNSDTRPVEAASHALKMFYHRFHLDPRRAHVQLFEILGVSPRIDREYREAMGILAGMVKLFLLKVFPGIQQEKLDRSIIPTGLAGSIIMIAHEWVLGDFAIPLEDIITQSMDFFIAIGNHLESGT
jgi:AcrR family transcriptional regulator